LNEKAVFQKFRIKTYDLFFRNFSGIIYKTVISELPSFLNQNSQKLQILDAPTLWITLRLFQKTVSGS